MNKSSDKIVIGKGGYGEIFYKKENPNTIYKQSYTVCNTLEKEYKMLSSAYRAYITYTQTKKSLRKRIHILHPYDWSTINSKYCIFKMARIYPPVGEKYVWHPHLGSEDFYLNKLYKTDLHIRGVQVGHNEIKKYLSLEQASKDSGILIGIVHYGAKLDAFDTELSMGIIKNHKTTLVQLVLIDFDKVSRWNQLSDKQLLENMISSLEAVPYYPEPETKYFSDFRDGYLDVAKHFGYEKLAQDVLNGML
uniref:Uncharacterized protein n=1 Tax=Pithovirus LCPAC001 TaxID=2506585 RepID=A0A481Z1B1_9VIRU|nr:MAG: hypothetical protein LCPAC001_00160 [Pithovirus LCPAC001]